MTQRTTNEVVIEVIEYVIVCGVSSSIEVRPLGSSVRGERVKTSQHPLTQDIHPVTVSGE